eukprot:g1480.t1
MGKAKVSLGARGATTMHCRVQKLKRNKRWKTQRKEYVKKHQQVHKKISEKSALRRQRNLLKGKSLNTKQVKADKVLVAVVDAILSLAKSGGSSEAEIASYLKSRCGHESAPIHGALAVTPVALKRSLLKGTKTGRIEMNENSGVLRYSLTGERKGTEDETMVDDAVDDLSDI